MPDKKRRPGVHTSAKMGCKRMKREFVSDFQVLASRVCFLNVHVFDSAIPQNQFAQTKVFILRWSFSISLFYAELEFLCPNATLKIDVG